ncbi:hypothetical protein [Wukongibacter sp. M2B1]|uniref:hypothetical protein n=1 Tax=Wukongibacter sp. M2B1 TaxID=3088895 RepID=UPI003D7938F3
MGNNSRLINTSEIFYKDMFNSNINNESKSIDRKESSIQVSKLINTNEIIYEDMVKF